MPPEALLGFAAIFPDPVLLVSTGGQVLACNAAAERLLGPKGAIAGRSLVDLVHDPPDRVDRLLRLWLRNPTVTLGALRWRGAGDLPIDCRVDGARVHPPTPGASPAVLLWCRPKREEETTSRFLALNERIAALSREIVERKRVEAELREQRERFRVTLGSIGDAVVTTDRDGRVTFMNDVARHLTGWTVEEAIGKPFGELLWLLNEETRQPADNPIARVLREGRVVGLANHTILVDRHGQEHPIDDSAAPIGGKDTPTVGVIMVFHDVSERRQLHREISRRVEELAEVDRRKDEFLAMLGHELRNPLSALVNAVAVQRTTGIGDRALTRAAQVIDRQLSMMGRLVDDLLDVARIRRGTIELRRESVDLRLAVDRAVETLREEFAARRLTLTLVQSTTPLLADVDVVRIEQVVTNLLSNALKYTPPGGRVEVATTREDGDAAVTVRDTGVGIDPALLPTIFDLFVQGRRAPHRPEGGLGIGLTLVRTIVELHGGRVEAQSAGPGQGSTFRVVLTCGADAAAPMSPLQSPAARTRLRVLVVDDHEDAADMLATLLRGYGHDVEIVHDGPTAIAAAIRWRPRLVLLDIGLPGMDGYAVAATLRHMRELEPLTIVALTGYGQAQDRERARAAGCDAHVVKPVAPETLRALLDTVR